MSGVGGQASELQTSIFSIEVQYVVNTASALRALATLKSKFVDRSTVLSPLYFAKRGQADRCWEGPLGGNAAERPNAGAVLPAMKDPLRALGPDPIDVHVG